MSDVLARFRALFTVLRPDSRMDIAAVYAPDVVFDDPIHHVEGLPALDAYFRRLNAQVREVRFVFGDEVLAEGAAMLAWTMHIDPRRGRALAVEGVSHLRFDDRVRRQRDWFDVGVFYEQIPLLGGVLRAVRRQM